ncbi:MAG: polyketide synthase of type I, partial [Gammaproteobacteria bacterium]|nr:polyketide synthase of type I [Gammaproteobacteria bacterium]
GTRSFPPFRKGGLGGILTNDHDPSQLNSTVLPLVGGGGNVGVFAGVMYEEYQLYGVQETLRGRPISLPGNPASIANRVSYFCNFHGPSMAVDTMCSSSLTTIHLACHSIRRGECELAIAGGVNVSIHPNKYLLLGQSNFVSSKGRCESFGQGGDGYVPGEGVGAVLLKPLSQAIADGDHIYGIIKATALNHGGKTHGYTVPNPTAQAGVIGRALKAAGIDPWTISYLEAHGTGTSLGDPIEIAGLMKAFQEYTQDSQFCAIGSVKSNIGHCESAAGIAGVTKVLLQLQHRQFVPSLHSEVLNPHIDFSKSPFVVQQELAEWKRPVAEINGETKEYPRRAGISSFGAGGANAHVVIEEYLPRDRERPHITVTPQNPTIIVLSARTEDQLYEQAQQLLAAIQEGQFSDSELVDMAYTLQVGRDAMEERLALMATSMQELVEQLQGVVEKQDGIEDLYRGQIQRHKEMLADFTADADMAHTIRAWIAKGKYAKLLNLWVKGLNIDWNRLYGETTPRRISLPTYPFAKERYWVPEIKTTSGDSSPETASSMATSLQTSISRHSLEPIPTTGTMFSQISDKPSGISLLQPGINSESQSFDKLRTLPETPGQATVSAEALQEELRTSLAEALYMKQSDVDVDKPFIDLGLDSILGVEWIRALSNQYGMTIPATRVYDYPTIREFTGFLAKELNAQGRQPPDNSALSASDQSLPKVSLQPIELPLPESASVPEGGTPQPIGTQDVEALQEELRTSLAEALYMQHSDVDVEKPFIDLGLDSIIGVEWIRALSNQYGIAIPATKVYDYPTIREFTGFLAQALKKHGGGLRQTLVPSPPSLSLNELIQQVQQGTLDVEQADQLLHKFHFQGETV